MQRITVPHMLLGLCCLVVAIPFLAVTFPPITDLPQQAAQIRLFLETVKDPEQGPYVIQWFTPYSLSYALLGASWVVFGPLSAGRMAMLTIALLWVIAIHGLASARSRSPESATVASLFVFNHVLYWGFYSFALGWPAFMLWFLLVDRTRATAWSVGQALLWMGAAVLLYVCHVLWLMAGVCWLVLSSLLFRVSFKEAAIRGLCAAPALALAAVWYPEFATSDMATPLLWATPFLERLSFFRFTDAALGGLQGFADELILLLVLGWILLAVLQNRNDLKDRMNRPLLAAGLMFLVFAIALPDKYMNTIRFGQRWMPFAMIMLLLALPAPSLTPLIRRAAAVTLVLALSGLTTAAWIMFETKELSGLRGALAALPEYSSLMGLDFVKKSEFIKGRPFIQIFAYGQVLKAARLNFSFAEFSPCLVVYKGRFLKPWTSGLEWRPEWVKPSDLDYFEHVLVNGDDRIQDIVRSEPKLEPVTEHGRWRLYRVKESPRDSLPETTR
ncbi:MAG: hypothetical protein FJ118_00810 [Deltaproteobacteria bacterium]|nr:hypothetical protein [Deltaproteobacteria bacterium]